MKCFCLTALLLLVQGAFAVEGESRATAEPAHKWGASVGIGNPYPSLLGINGAYNIDDHMRATVGYGEVEITTGVSFDGNSLSEEKLKAQTYSAGLDYLFLQSGIRPLIGAHAGYFSVSGKGNFEIQGISKSTALVYSNVGADWLTASGFNMGAGLNIALAGGHGANFYADVGYFF